MNQNVTILIVDDDPDILMATARILQSDGYIVRKASSGKECLEQVRQTSPDLILMDMMLPDINGDELCKTIKADDALRQTFIVLISGMKTSSLDQAEGLEIGADGYISRPISNRELKARIHAMVRILVAERERDQLIAELREAMAEIKTLSGLLPICSYCKMIRDDKGYWNQLESYIHKNSGIKFSHSICPVCAKKHHPDMDLYED